MRFTLYSGIAAFAILASVYGSGPVFRSRSASHPVEIKLAGEAAYRDGLYLGRLDRQNDKAAKAALGRWSTDKDRKLFLKGYTVAYGK